MTGADSVGDSIQFGDQAVLRESAAHLATAVGARQVQRKVPPPCWGGCFLLLFSTPPQPSRRRAALAAVDERPWAGRHSRQQPGNTAEISIPCTDPTAAVPQLPDFEAGDGGSTEHGFESRREEQPVWASVYSRYMTPTPSRSYTPLRMSLRDTQSRPRVVAKLAHRSCADQYRLKKSSVDASNVLEADDAHQPSHLLHCNREIAGLQYDGLGFCAVHWRELE